MTWDPEQIWEDFRIVARLAGVMIPPDAVTIDRRPAPHEPPRSLPPGSMAVYVFTLGTRALKVGKVGARSGARYTSQHYNAGSAPSTLAASLVQDGERIGIKGLDKTNVSAWIRENTDRVDFVLDAELGVQVLNLLEAFLQCFLQPEFEGFVSQRLGQKAG